MEPLLANVIRTINVTRREKRTGINTKISDSYMPSNVHALDMAWNRFLSAAFYHILVSSPSRRNQIRRMMDCQ